MANAVSVNDLSIGGKIRFIAKNGTDVYKAEVVSVDKKAKIAVLKALEGPSEGKSIKIAEDRLKRMQGRQPGFSPASTKKTDTAVPKNAGKDKPAAAPKGTKKAEVTEEMDLTSAREELKDLIEATRDTLERLESISDFMDNLEIEEGDDEEAEEEGEEEAEESPAPAPKGKGRRRSRPMDDEDEA